MKVLSFFFSFFSFKKTYFYVIIFFFYSKIKGDFENSIKCRQTVIEVRVPAYVPVKF